MAKTKFRGMNVLRAKSANGNAVAMGINGDLESSHVGDTVFAILNQQGRILRRADSGEFMNVALKNDEVSQCVYPNIQSWEFPDWHCLAYHEQELSTMFWLYRTSTGSTPNQYGVLVRHVGPQSSGKPREGNGRALMHRQVVDLDIDEFDYLMECHPGYSIETVVEALPTFTPMKYDDWTAQMTGCEAIPFEFEQGYYTGLPTVVPNPPRQFQGTAGRWLRAIEETVGSKIKRPWPLIEVTWDRYDAMCASVGHPRNPDDEEE